MSQIVTMRNLDKNQHLIAVPVVILSVIFRSHHHQKHELLLKGIFYDRSQSLLKLILFQPPVHDFSITIRNHQMMRDEAEGILGHVKFQSDFVSKSIEVRLFHLVHQSLVMIRVVQLSFAVEEADVVNQVRFS